MDRRTGKATWLTALFDLVLPLIAPGATTKDLDYRPAVDTAVAPLDLTRRGFSSATMVHLEPGKLMAGLKLPALPV
jgi:hypothetical protein